MFNCRRLAVVSMGKDDQKETHVAILVYGTSGSSSSSSSDQASKPSSSELDFGQILQVLQSNIQAREQSVAHQTAVTTLLL